MFYRWGAGSAKTIPIPLLAEPPQLCTSQNNCGGTALCSATRATFIGTKAALPSGTPVGIVHYGLSMNIPPRSCPALAPALAGKHQPLSGRGGRPQQR